MPVPKRRTTRSKRDKRRANHNKIAVANLVPCPNCGEMILPHRLCPECGHYAGRAVLEQKKEAST